MNWTGCTEENYPDDSIIDRVLEDLIIVSSGVVLTVGELYVIWKDLSFIFYLNDEKES